MLRSPLSSPLKRPLQSPLAARRGGGAAFDPATLFASGELGTWLDRQDTSTMFADIFGQTQISSGNSMGLALSKDAGLSIGAELNGDVHFNDPSFWNNSSPNTSVSGGQAIWTNASSGARVASNVQTINVVAGRAYRVTVDVDSVSAGILRLAYAAGGEIFPNMTASGVYTFRFVASQTTSMWLRCVNTTTAAVNSMRFEELNGNHATQANVTLRPIYQVSPPRSVFDGIDDVHVVSFPSSLGSNCTIGRSLPGVGAQILTAQTIGTSYNVNVTDSGLVIVNRSLTAGETAGLTSYLEAAAFF
jgi:uncharacterized protein YqfB (UPF0267 family)